MEVKWVDNKHIELYEMEHHGTETIVHRNTYPLKTVKYDETDNGVSMLDQFLIDVRVKENAKELYLLSIDEFVQYDPSNYQPKKVLSIIYYAHPKINGK